MALSGTLRLSAGLALAAAVGLGVLHGRRSHRDRHDRAAARSAARAAASRPKARDPDLSDADRRAAEAAATDELLAGRFREAHARLSALWPRTPEGVDRTRLRRLAVRARIVAALAATVPESALGRAPRLAELRLQGGRPYLVAIRSESTGRVELELASGVALSLPRARIASLVPLGRVAFEQRLQASLAARLAALEPTDPLGRFRLAYFCLEHGLRREAAPHILAAVDADETGLLVAAFCPPSKRPTAEERRLLYPARVVRGARGLAALASAAGGGAPPVSAAPAASARGVAPAPREGRGGGLREAMPTIRAALSSYRQSFRGGPGAQRALARAEALFREARDALMALGERGQGGPEVDQLIQELQRYLVDCAKVSQLER